MFCYVTHHDEQHTVTVKEEQDNQLPRDCHQKLFYP